jgi:hypothetical protein
MADFGFHLMRESLCRKIPNAERHGFEVRLDSTNPSASLGLKYSQYKEDVMSRVPELAVTLGEILAELRSANLRMTSHAT